MSIAEKLQTIAENEQRVYDAGKAYGKKLWESGFWDLYQENGNRTNYLNAFRYGMWNDEYFNPKYPIKAVGDASYAFQNVSAEWKDKTLEVDLSEATNCTWIFRNSRFNHLGKIDFSSATTASGTFSFMESLKSIREIVVHKDLHYDGAFAYATALEDVTFSGVIGQNGLNFQVSAKLSKESITSIVNALSTTTSGLTVTLSKIAVIRAFATASGANDGATSQEWLNLVATKSNWTISLV